MTPAQIRKINRDYYWSLAFAIGTVGFGVVASGFQVPPMGYYWASLFVIITATGRRIFDTLTIAVSRAKKDWE